MSDKIDKEESISRVYQFLNKQKDWKSDADKNGDGTVIKAEFRSYLLGSGFKFNNGENKEDIIETFWKSIDSNTSGKVGGGSQISNKNALDAKEMQKIQGNIEATQKVSDFFKNNNITVPQGLDSKYHTKWKESVKAGMLNKVIEFITNDSIANLTDEKMAEFYNVSSIKATADYKAAEQIDKQLAGQYGDIGYKAGSDETLSNIIDEYIKSLTGSESSSNVMSDVTVIVNAYVALAKDGNDANAIAILSKYGYDESEINPLQEAVITNSIKNTVNSRLTSAKADMYSAYKDVINAKLTTFIAEVINSGESYNNIKNNINKYVSEFMSKLADIEAQYEQEQKEIKTARAELNTYIGKILAEGNSKKIDIVKSVIGTADATQVMNKLLELKTVAEVNAKKTELETKIAEYETQITTVTDKSAELKQENIVTGAGTPAFYVSNDGSIVFVNYNASHGVFDDKANSSMNSQFANLRTKLEASYAENIEAFGLSSTELKNLFNAALYMALSDESVLRSQYEAADLSTIADATIENYIALLKKIATDTKARDYIKNYSSKSIIAGRSVRSSGNETTSYKNDWNRSSQGGNDNSGLTHNMDKYYRDDTTSGDDDWVSINSTTPHTTNFGEIIYLNSGEAGDDNPANAAMESLFNDYLNTYSKILDTNKLTSLYKQAQETAIRKLLALTDSTKPAGSSVYGYGENRHGEDYSQYDTKSADGAGNGHISVPALLIEIMYEMERLIALAVAGKA